MTPKLSSLYQSAEGIITGHHGLEVYLFSQGSGSQKTEMRVSAGSLPLTVSPVGTTFSPSSYTFLSTCSPGVRLAPLARAPVLADQAPPWTSVLISITSLKATSPNITTVQGRPSTCRFERDRIQSLAFRTHRVCGSGAWPPLRGPCGPGCRSGCCPDDSQICSHHNLSGEGSLPG